MFQKITITFYAILLTFTFGCRESMRSAEAITNSPKETIAKEKTAILNVLNDETAAAFNRDYDTWKKFWIHEKYVTKTYMNFEDNSLTETLGWKEVDDFVRTYIEEHPEPAPLPKPLETIDVRVYGNGAWVDYRQTDPNLGLKRESRLMEKSDGQWKIAGMQTVIYGFEEKN